MSQLVSALRRWRGRVEEEDKEDMRPSVEIPDTVKNILIAPQPFFTAEGMKDFLKVLLCTGG